MKAHAPDDEEAIPLGQPDDIAVHELHLLPHIGDLGVALLGRTSVSTWKRNRELARERAEAAGAAAQHAQLFLRESSIGGQAWADARRPGRVESVSAEFGPCACCCSSDEDGEEAASGSGAGESVSESNS